jgi:tRNA/tmRNA/rRNA uracil-C5-methylase (TrmA/RlmC/RlmD family)
VSERWTGREFDVDIGAPAHGGSCVARHEGRVLFVRHALPGERVRVRVTEDGGGSFCRADAVSVLSASAERVTPPCPHAGPGRCGGCDWQHASAPAQRRIKADVICDQFRRVADLDPDLTEVEALPGGLLGWRTRVSFAVDSAGTVGLHRHRSHELEPLEHCPLGVPEVADARPAPMGATGVEAIRGEDGAVSVLARRPGQGRQARGRRPPDRTELISGTDRVTHRVGQHVLTCDAAGFWQVHPAALQAFVAAVLAAVAPRTGETVLDLYCGAGALTIALAEAVGSTGRVIGVESSGQAVADAEANLADLPWAYATQARVNAVALAELDVAPDIVIVDPPRAGVGIEAMRSLAALAPRAIGYLSCDPATLARDVRAVLDRGWRLTALRAFDAFPMTHHVECLALIEPDTQARG